MPHCDRSTDILLFLILCCLFSFGYKWKMIGSFSLIPMFITNNSMHAFLFWLSLLRFVYLFTSVTYFLLRSYIFNQTGYFVHCKLYGNHFDQNNEWFETWLRWMRRVNEKTHTYILPTPNWIRCSQNDIAACWLDWSTSTLWE